MLPRSFVAVVLFVTTFVCVQCRWYGILRKRCRPSTVNAECVLIQNDGATQNLNGIIRFKQHQDEYCMISPLRVDVGICGFDNRDKNLFHGIHVHKNGHLLRSGNKAMCSSAGGHYNPFETNHGAPTNNIWNRHVGDFGNIIENRRGCVKKSFHDYVARLFDAGPRNIMGRAIVIHAKEDDLGLGRNEGSLKTGNAGARLACCTIRPTYKQ